MPTGEDVTKLRQTGWLPAYSATDAILRCKGEPQRYFFKPGPWSVADKRPK